ncbi:MAG: nicotinamide-nucleotide amidohydrolase family protein [Planctomycetota bacterium]
MTFTQRIHKLFSRRGLTVATAESCTGGVVATQLTRMAGSSRYFILGLVTYANRSKTQLLGIPPALILRHGAVSRPVAERMARGVRRLARADFGVGITGIAGPSGGSPEKPVGLVFIAVAGPERTAFRACRLAGSRPTVRRRAADAALRLLAREATGKCL